MSVRSGNSCLFVLFYISQILPTHLIDDDDEIISVCRFGEESMRRVLRWMDKANITEDAAILDIGTGNGAFLVELV